MSNEMFSDDPTQIVTPAPITIDKLPDDVAGLIGEGKKYATLELALKSLTPAQAHIAKLEEENRQLREAGQQAQNIEEVYAAVKERLELERVPTPQGLDPASVAALVDGRIAEVTMAQKLAANEASFKAVLSETFGDKAGEKFNTTAEALGYTRAEFSELARTRPNAALKLLGVEKKAVLPKQIQSTVNPEAFTQRPQDPPQRKSVMQGASTKDVVDAWRAAKPTE